MKVSPIKFRSINFHPGQWLLCAFVLCLGCQPTPREARTTATALPGDSPEAREDSLALVAAYAAQEKIPHAVYPANETQAILAAKEEDAADDPAIWVHPTDPEKSLIYGSNKRGGLAVYNLAGEEVDYYPIGNINNVDIVTGFPMGDGETTLLGCSNRSDQSIDLFVVDPANGKLTDIAAGDLKVDPAKIDDIYGFCFARVVSNGLAYAIINGKNGMMQQFELIPDGEKLKLILRREVQFDSQTEGMVADNEMGFLYVGEEGRGIWKLAIDPEKGVEKSFVALSGQANPNIAYDIEGLTLYKKNDTGYLIASSQGNFSYAIFDRLGDNPYLTSIKILGNPEWDGVEETDGLDVVTDSLGPDFPNGLMVVQDGFNYQGDTLMPQNFKLIDWSQVEQALTPEG